MQVNYSKIKASLGKSVFSNSRPWDSLLFATTLELSTWQSLVDNHRGVEVLHYHYIFEAEGILCLV